MSLLRTLFFVGLLLITFFCFDINDGKLVGAETYDFESLGVNGFINGQDNWVDQSGQGQAVISLDTTGNGTKVVRHMPTVAINQDAFVTRANDASFSFPHFYASQTEALIQFDLNGEYVALFALGHDVNGDGRLTADPFGDGSGGEVGPAFGTYGTGVGNRNFALRPASLEQAMVVELGQGNSGNDWYRMQLRMDFTANEESGVGSLFYMNISDGDTTFQPVLELQGIGLGLDNLHAGAGPGAWDTMWLQLRTGGSGSIPAADNLVPNPSAIPEPTSLALLLVGAFFLGAIRRPASSRRSHRLT